MHILKRPLVKSRLLSYVIAIIILVPLKSHANEISFFTGQLTNGLTYYIHRDPHSRHYISLDFIIKAGSLDEQEDEMGFSHLIEHNILNKVQFKDKKISDLHCEIWDFSSFNTYCGAVTSYAFTQYHFEISLAIPRGLEEGLLGFSNVLSQFSLDEQDLKEMKDEVLYEIDKNQISCIESWKQWRIGQEYPPYRNKHPFGNQASTSQASLEKIHRFYEKKYQPHHIAVVIIGNIDLPRTKLLIEKHFGHISTSDEEEMFRPDSEPFSERNLVYVDKRLKNILISLTKPLSRMSQRDSLTFSILTQMLSQHLKSSSTVPEAKFSQPILETLIYPPMLRLTVSLMDDLVEDIDQLKVALNSFFNQPITENQLNSIKAEMKNNLKILREKGNDPSLLDFYRDHFILNTSSLETDHPDLRIDLLDTIYAEDINHMLRSFQGFSQASLASPDVKAALISPDPLSKLLLKNIDYGRNSYVD